MTKTTAAVATVLVGAALAGLAGLAWYLQWSKKCCEFSGGEPGEVFFCEHGKAWLLGQPTLRSFGPLHMVTVPGWQRIATETAMKLLADEIDIESDGFLEAVGEDPDCSDA